MDSTVFANLLGGHGPLLEYQEVSGVTEDLLLPTDATLVPAYRPQVS